MVETDMRAIVRNADLTPEQKREAMAKAFQATVKAKLPGHGINDPTFIQPTRPMSAIGG
jgi:cyclic pyranopterin phosphate synthase